MHARIRWKTKEEGGRRSLPAGRGDFPYAPIVRLKDDPEVWPPEVAWSLVVEKIDNGNDDLEWIAEVRYLVSEAPSQELYVGREFELYEGPHCVASGRILGDKELAT